MEAISGGGIHPGEYKNHIQVMCGYFGVSVADWQLLYGDITPFPPGTKHVCQFIQAVREQHCAGRPCEALWPSFRGFHENYLWNRETKLVASLFPGCQRALEQGVLQFAGLCGGTWVQVQWGYIVSKFTRVNEISSLIFRVNKFLSQVPTAPDSGWKSFHMCRARTRLPFFTTMEIGMLEDAEE